MTTLNSCGLEVFKVNDYIRLQRFLMLGNENGSYYINNTKLTEQNMQCLERLIQNEPSIVIDICIEYVDRIYKKDYLLFVLARCCAEQNSTNLREDAYVIVQQVCQTPTHLFMFVEFYEKLHMKLHQSTGWNKLHKTQIAKWYLDKNIVTLTYQTTKYKNRNGWSHQDVLRLCHVKTTDTPHNCLFAYLTRGYEAFKEKINDVNDDDNTQLLEYITDYEEVKTSTDIDRIVELVKKHEFVIEHLNKTALSSLAVWQALVAKMPMIALLRNLNKMTAVGLFDSFSTELHNVILALSSEQIIKKTKVHPLQILIALYTYSNGRGVLGNKVWNPVPEVCTALNTAFKLSFVNTERTGKRFCLALDVSGSMKVATVCGIASMTAAQIATAMAMVFASKESMCDIMGFANTYKELDLNLNTSVEYNMSRIYNQSFGLTDISLPFTHAQKHNLVYDVFIVFTDNETNCNTIRPIDALNLYRTHINKNAKLIVVALCANQFSIADPDDSGMLDIAGFDADTPQVIRDFVLQ